MAASPKTSVPPTWYHATATPAPDLPALEDEISVDVCVIGGGLTGVSTALHLAERGYKVALLEGERIGWGASGRNGGQIVSGLSCDMEVVEREIGVDGAKDVWDMTREAIDDIEERTRRHKIPSDLRWGYLFAANRPHHLADLSRTSERWAATYRYERTRVVDKSLVRAFVGTDEYVGGMIDQGSGQMHPLNYLLGLADLARFLGVEMFEHSRVTRIERGSPARVKTARGVVTARMVAVCGNAYLGGLVRETKSRLARVASYVGVTEPLAPDVAQAILPQDVAVADCRVALDYYRMTDDDRLLFGSGAHYTGAAPARLGAAVHRRIRSVFPGLSAARIDYVWSGYIGITVNRAPDLGRIGDNIYYAQGFSGHGLAVSGMSGKLLAAAIAGEAERFELMASIQHMPFPGGPFRLPSLVLGMAWYKLKDRFGL